MKFCIVFLVFCVYISPGKTTNCVTRGRFPDNSHLECRGYTMCLSGATSYDLLCPEHSIFSHFENQCTNVTTYQCLPNYNCTNVGNYKSSENDCKSYISCIKDLNNITTARLIACSANEIFSVTEGLCVNETLYECNPTTESPKILEVHIDQVKIVTGKALNNAGHTNTMYFIHFITMCIAVRLL